VRVEDPGQLVPVVDEPGRGAIVLDGVPHEHREGELPAALFILAFLTLDIVAYRHTELSAVNYIAHFSGFAAGALFKLAFWNTFTTEKPEPRKKVPYSSRLAHDRATRR
jgi:hypothetical protein